MARPNGINHLAIMTADIKTQIEFFSDILGLKLTALYWMHNVDQTWHGFLELNPTSSIAFVQSPAVNDIQIEVGKTHAGNPTNPSAAGTMQHVSLNVDTDEDLYSMRDRIRSHGIPVLGPLDHGFCKSIYFAGLECLTLEISSQAAPLNGEEWIDPEVVGRAGISNNELQRFKNPAPYHNDGDPIAQPSMDTDKPVYAGMGEDFRGAYDLPDEVVLSEMSDNIPPVKVA
jgi:catechol 2,3-dioxygenase-like lactoylglutathione lyase family enzyme